LLLFLKVASKYGVLYLSAGLLFGLSANQPVGLPANLPVGLPASLSVCLSVCPPTYLHPVHYLSACLPVCLHEIIDDCWINNRAHLLILQIKGGHPQFKSAPLQYCGQPNRLRNCGPSKFDFHNSQQFPASSTTF
jgi:hypothetical protein